MEHEKSWQELTEEEIIETLYEVRIPYLSEIERQHKLTHIVKNTPPKLCKQDVVRYGCWNYYRTTDDVLNQVSREFNNMQGVGSSWRVFIHFWLKKGVFLFNDTFLEQSLVHDLLISGKLIPDCVAYCDGHKVFRYRFTGFPYPIKFDRQIPDWLRKEVLRRDDYRCVGCGTEHRLSIDHILAWSRGGWTELENLQTLCRSCNCKKHAK